MSKSHTAEIRVYYEDTDAGGVVYYANYLKYAERARTEMLRERGINQSELVAEEGLLFVVRRFSADLKKPARLDDIIEIKTSINEISGVKIHMLQIMSVNDQEIMRLNVDIACISSDFRPKRLSEVIRDKLIA